jgi:transcriptional regulator with XRE-family HTH domain
MPSLSPGMCRAARALLGWSQLDLVARSRVSAKTIGDFEIDARQPYERTLEALRRAFEDAGLRFIDPVEGVTGEGVALKWGVAPPVRHPGAGESTAGEAGEGGLKAAWDDFEDSADLDALLAEEPGLNPDMAELWRDDPELWARLSEGGRETLSKRMFGDSRAAGEGYFRDQRPVG